MSKIRLSEPPFRSIQGEGNRAGVLSIWIRFAGCSLRCPGFFQHNPTDPSTYINPLDKKPSEYKTLESIPVLKYGCDSLYSIDPRFKHLWKDYTLDEIVTTINSLTYNGKWKHPITKNNMDICFTGGEPLMQQKNIISIIKNIDRPSVIQFETNATKSLSKEFEIEFHGADLSINWNISPKLFNVTGEFAAVDYDNILQYWKVSSRGALKFVVNDRDDTWTELDSHVKEIKKRGANFPVYIMPVGGTYEQQTDSKVLEKIAKRAIDNGYHVSGRLHVVLFSNNIGT